MSSWRGSFDRAGRRLLDRRVRAWSRFRERGEDEPDCDADGGDARFDIVSDSAGDRPYGGDMNQHVVEPGQGIDYDWSQDHISVKTPAELTEGGSRSSRTL